MLAKTTTKVFCMNLSNVLESTAICITASSSLSSAELLDALPRAPSSPSAASLQLKHEPLQIELGTKSSSAPLLENKETATDNTTKPVRFNASNISLNSTTKSSVSNSEEIQSSITRSNPEVQRVIEMFEIHIPFASLSSQINFRYSELNYVEKKKKMTKNQNWREFKMKKYCDATESVDDLDFGECLLRNL